MKIFKNRAVAALIALVVVVLAWGISAQAGLKQAIRDVEMLYYDGVPAESGGYLRPSIDSQMRVKYNCVNTILGILAGYEELASVTQDLEDAKNYVYSYLNEYDDYTINGMGWANQELESVITRLQVEMERVTFTERESEMLEQCLSDIRGAQTMIQNAGYNEAVREFNSTEMERFPANMLLTVIGNYNGGAAYFS